MSGARPIPNEARRLCRTTPLVFSSVLGCWLKLESLQVTGSFKLRGAAVKLARLPADERARGVVTASAGNHGLGVAKAAAAFGVQALVVVPSGAPRKKRDGIAQLGAEVRVLGASYDEAEAAARALAASLGVLFVSGFDDDDVIDGNGGWLAEELFAQRPSLRQVIAPVGGGGLLGGLARALAPRGVRAIGVQPRVNCAMHDSLAGGRALTRYDGGATWCEGLEGAVAERTFELVRAHVEAIALVDEAAVRAAMAMAYRELGLVVEASAAVGLAAVAVGALAVDRETAIVVTGSNVDDDRLREALG